LAEPFPGRATLKGEATSWRTARQSSDLILCWVDRMCSSAKDVRPFRSLAPPIVAYRSLLDSSS